MSTGNRIGIATVFSALMFGLFTATTHAALVQTLEANFNVTTSGTDNVTGESGPSGTFNPTGLDIAGPGAAVQWTNILVSSSTQTNATDNGITLTLNTNTVVTQGESPGGFVAGDLRDRTGRLLGVGFGSPWDTHPGVNWEISNLINGGLYDLIFYGGDANRPNLQSIVNTVGSQTTDADGDVNVTGVVADGSGKITGTWLVPAGSAITNWGGLEIASVADVPAPAALPAGLAMIGLVAARRRR